MVCLNIIIQVLIRNNLKNFSNSYNRFPVIAFGTRSGRGYIRPGQGRFHRLQGVLGHVEGHVVVGPTECGANPRRGPTSGLVVQVLETLSRATDLRETLPSKSLK